MNLSIIFLSAFVCARTVIEKNSCLFLLYSNMFIISLCKYKKKKQKEKKNVKIVCCVFQFFFYSLKNHQFTCKYFPKMYYLCCLWSFDTSLFIQNTAITNCSLFIYLRISIYCLRTDNSEGKIDNQCHPIETAVKKNGML